ncbi:hypothetical protein [Ramlibacter sp. PS4R-6]|uniref:hypothetical protein n=1 Tax=Ramlibacter sp. PS4R-6 TaxID=3133438 RepID=UPI00309556B8
MNERVVGPIKGYYIASYACEMGELGDRYLGFAKLCLARPEDYWQARACAKFSSEHLADSPEHAMETAETRARMQIANMSAHAR